MKALIASIAGLGLIASPALATAAKTNSTTKTMTTKAEGAKATTTVTTKVTPASAKGTSHARVKSHRVARASKSAAKPAPKKG